MKKADNFDATKWLVENKITFQSRLNENEVPVPKTLTPSAKKKVDDLIARAEVANKNKDAEELEKIYYEALKINPRSAFGYFMKVLRNKGIAKKGYLGFVWSFEDPARLNMKPPTSRYDDDSLNEVGFNQSSHYVDNDEADEDARLSKMNKAPEIHGEPMGFDDEEEDFEDYEDFDLDAAFEDAPNKAPYNDVLEIIKSYEYEDLLKSFMNSFPKGKPVSKDEYFDWNYKNMDDMSEVPYIQANWISMFDDDIFEKAGLAF